MVRCNYWNLVKKVDYYLVFTVVEQKAPINVSTAKKTKDITTPKI